jgi:CHAT domain-containing protein
LQLEDILALRMNADWVILSACNTAAAGKVGGDQLSGLARGFFYAGAQSMLVTHWAVESKSAAAITTSTVERYARNKKLSRAQALRMAQIDLIEGRGEQEYWSHPAFWAPYALVGNSRRGVD